MVENDNLPNILNGSLDINKKYTFTNYSPINQKQKIVNRFDENYIILEKIGKGGNAIVLKGYKKETNSYVAIKLCNSQKGRNIEKENDILTKIQTLNKHGKRKLVKKTALKHKKQVSNFHQNSMQEMQVHFPG